MSRRERELRSLPGYGEARAALARLRPLANTVQLDQPGLWIPRQAVDRVTVSLLDAIFVAEGRQHAHKRYEKEDSSQVISMTDFLRKKSAWERYWEITRQERLRGIWRRDDAYSPPRRPGDVCFYEFASDDQLRMAEQANEVEP